MTAPAADEAVDPVGDHRRTAPVVVGGALASKLHNGGEAWVRMSWLRGLHSLGRDAWLFEEIADPSPAQVDYFRDVTTWFAAAERSVLLDGEGKPVVCPDGVDPRDVATSAELLLNISGHLRAPAVLERFDRRVLIDIDPGFTQIWHAQGLAGARVDGHHAFATIGERIGQPDCPIPTGGLPWIPTRQPVVLDDWSAAPPDGGAPFTTVASWRGCYGPVEHAGRRYGVKAHEFRKLVDLPGRAPAARLEVALDIHPGDDLDRTALLTHGWLLTDPSAATGSPAAFRRYVHASAGEVSPAQGLYVDTRSGWFSDRTVRYLAAGRPAIVQDTGFTDTLPTGAGLLAFSDVAGAAGAIEAVLEEYPRHAAAARALAAEHFAADRVLADLLERLR